MQKSCRLPFSIPYSSYAGTALGVDQCLPERRSHHSLKPNSWRPPFALLRLPLFLLRVLPPLTTLPPLAALPLLQLVHHLPLLDVRKRVTLLAHLQAAPGQTARPERLKAASPNSSLPPQRGRAASKFSHVRWQARPRSRHRRSATSRPDILQARLTS